MDEPVQESIPNIYRLQKMLSSSLCPENSTMVFCRAKYKNSPTPIAHEYHDLAGKGMGVDFGIFIHTEKGANLAFMVQDLNSRYQWKQINI
jgi:hypothetical protein